MHGQKNVKLKDRELPIPSIMVKVYTKCYIISSGISLREGICRFHVPLTWGQYRFLVCLTEGIYGFHVILRRTAMPLTEFRTLDGWYGIRQHNYL